MDLQLWDSLSNLGCIEGFGAQQLSRVNWPLTLPGRVRATKRLSLGVDLLPDLLPY